MGAGPNGLAAAIVLAQGSVDILGGACQLVRSLGSADAFGEPCDSVFGHRSAEKNPRALRTQRSAAENAEEPMPTEPTQLYFYWATGMLGAAATDIGGISITGSSCLR